MVIKRIIASRTKYAWGFGLEARREDEGNGGKECRITVENKKVGMAKLIGYGRIGIRTVLWLKILSF